MREHPFGLAPDERRGRGSGRRAVVGARAPLFVQELLDPGDRLVDRLLGADALGSDAVYGPLPGSVSECQIGCNPYIVVVRPREGLGSPTPYDADRWRRAKKAARGACASAAANDLPRSRDSARANPPRPGNGRNPCPARPVFQSGTPPRERGRHKSPAACRRHRSATRWLRCSGGSRPAATPRSRSGSTASRLESSPRSAPQRRRCCPCSPNRWRRAERSPSDRRPYRLLAL